MRRGVLVGLVVATSHFVVSLFTVMIAFGAGMARFDTGAAPSLGERVVLVIRDVVLFPLAPLLVSVLPGRWFPGLWGYIPFAANSLLWGATIATIVVLTPRVRRRVQRSMLRR
jgi:hypothetical protein